MHVVLKILSSFSRSPGIRVLRSNQSVVLGRVRSEDPNHICLEKDPRVSRQHAVIHFDGEEVTVTDLGSSNGTFLRNKKLRRETPYLLHDKEELEIGGYVVIVQLISQSSQAALADRTQVISLLPDGYELLEDLGSGGMGRVWKARNKLLGREVAIKLLHEGASIDPSVEKRFLREAQIGANIDSPNIVKIHDARMFRGRMFLIMEYVNGPSLQELRERGRIDLGLIIKISRDISFALQQLLSAAIIHRDVKPANILLNEEGTAKLTDFGIARPLLSDATIDLPRGMGFGSLPYVAPEQANEAEDADERSDIYGLGATMYFMLTGAPPREAASYETLLRMFDEEVVPPHHVMKSCPLALSDLVVQMLEIDPYRRPQGPGAVLSKLEVIMRQFQDEDTARMAKRRWGSMKPTEGVS